MVSDKWINYKIIFAYGQIDHPNWKIKAIEAKEVLKDKVDIIEIFEMKDQVHLLKPEYDIGQVFQLYFK